MNEEYDRKEKSDVTHEELLNRIIDIQKEVSELHGALYKNGFVQRVYEIDANVKKNTEHIQHLLAFEQGFKDDEISARESQFHQERMTLGNRRLLLGIIGLLFGNGALVLVINYILEKVG
jgi:hypothetical protein